MWMKTGKSMCLSSAKKTIRGTIMMKMDILC